MEKDKYREKAKKSIDDIFAKIDELEAKKDKADKNAKEKYNQRIEELKAKRNELKENYNELVRASDAQWETAKSNFSESADYFKKGFAELGELFK